MNKDKKIITFTIIAVVSILLLSVILFFIQNNINNRNKEQKDIYVTIYQYEVSNFNFDMTKERKLYKRILFTKDTVYDETIHSLDNKLFNHVSIKNGLVCVLEANCHNHICMNQEISLDQSIINNTTISCFPSGLYICLEYGD